jgi:hypothetical protein
VSKKSERDELDRKALDMRVSGYRYWDIARKLGISETKAHNAVLRGLERSRQERPAQAIVQYEQARRRVLECREKVAAGDMAEARLLPKWEKIYRYAVSFARHYNSTADWQPEPLPDFTPPPPPRLWQGPIKRGYPYADLDDDLDRDPYDEDDLESEDEDL